MRGRDRRAGRHLVGAFRRRHQDVDAGRRDRDVAAAVGAGEQLVVDVGRGDRDDVLVGGREQRRRLRPGIAGRRDQDHALVVGGLERALERGIARAGEAHVDDAHAVVHGVVEPLEDVEGRALRARGLGGEGADREQPRARRDAEQPAVRGDRARHAGAVRVRLLLDAGGVVAVDHGAFEIGMAGVDLGIDHRDRDVGCARAAEDVAHLELLQHVLPGIALHAIARADPARACRCSSPDRRRRCGCWRARGWCWRCSDRLSMCSRWIAVLMLVRHCELSTVNCRRVSAVVQRLLRRIARQLDHHLILHEAGFFGRRQVEVAAGADVEPGRIVDARNGRRTRTGLRLLLLLLLRLIEELRVEKIGRRRWRIDRIVCRTAEASVDCRARCFDGGSTGEAWIGVLRAEVDELRIGAMRPDGRIKAGRHRTREHRSVARVAAGALLLAGGLAVPVGVGHGAGQG